MVATIRKWLRMTEIGRGTIRLKQKRLRKKDWQTTTTRNIFWKTEWAVYLLDIISSSIEQTTSLRDILLFPDVLGRKVFINRWKDGLRPSQETLTGGLNYALMKGEISINFMPAVWTYVYIMPWWSKPLEGMWRQGRCACGLLRPLCGLLRPLFGLLRPLCGLVLVI